MSYEHDYGTITIGDNDKELVDGKSKALIIGSWLPGDNLIYIRSNGIEQKVNVNVYPVNINIESNIKNDEEKETIEMNVEVIDINNNNIDDSLNVYWFSTGGDIYGHEKIIDGKAVGTLTKTKSGTVYVLLTVAATTKILKFGDNTFTDNNSYIKINDLSKKLRNVINNNISLKQSDHYNDDFISEIIWSIFSRNDKKLIIRLLNSHFTKNLNIHENSAFIDWVDILIDIFQSKTKHENTEVAKQAMLFHEFLKSYRSLVNDSYNYYFRQIIFYLLNNIVNTYISNNHDGLQMIRRYFRLFNILSEESDATTTNISKVISTPYSLDV